MEDKSGDDIFERDSKVVFDNNFDYKPLEKSFLQRMEDKAYSILRGKKAQPAVTPKPTEQPKPVVAKPRVEDPIPYRNPLDGHELVFPNPTPLRKKTFIDKARDQLKFPQISKLGAAVNGLALIIFVSGAYLLYSSLPTRPELVIGIVMVSVAGNVVISSR